jgi:hypothetical protein
MNLFLACKSVSSSIRWNVIVIGHPRQANNNTSSTIIVIKEKFPALWDVDLSNQH